MHIRANYCISVTHSYGLASGVVLMLETRLEGLREAAFLTTCTPLLVSGEALHTMLTGVFGKYVDCLCTYMYSLLYTVVASGQELGLHQ